VIRIDWHAPGNCSILESLKNELMAIVAEARGNLGIELFASLFLSVFI